VLNAHTPCRPTRSIPVVAALLALPADSVLDILVTIPFALALWLGQAVWALLRYPTPQAPWAAQRGTWLANAFRGLGLLRPLARFPLGAMLLGALGALCVYCAVGVPVLGFPLRPAHLLLGLAAALLIGPAFGLGFRNDAS
jgi:hypothetical protein